MYSQLIYTLFWIPIMAVVLILSLLMDIQNSSGVLAYCTVQVTFTYFIITDVFQQLRQQQQ
jgi:hypothetical protein